MPGFPPLLRPRDVVALRFGRGWEVVRDGVGLAVFAAPAGKQAAELHCRGGLWRVSPRPERGALVLWNPVGGEGVAWLARRRRRTIGMVERRDDDLVLRRGGRLTDDDGDVAKIATTGRGAAAQVHLELADRREVGVWTPALLLLAVRELLAVLDPAVAAWGPEEDLRLLRGEAYADKLGLDVGGGDIGGGGGDGGGGG